MQLIAAMQGHWFDSHGNGTLQVAAQSTAHRKWDSLLNMAAYGPIMPATEQPYVWIT